MKVEVDGFRVKRPVFRTRLSKRGTVIEPLESPVGPSSFIRREEVEVRSLIDIGKVIVQGEDVIQKVRDGEGVDEYDVKRDTLCAFEIARVGVSTLSVWGRYYDTDFDTVGGRFLYFIITTFFSTRL